MSPPVPGTLAPGSVLGGRYRIESALARGGMGAVYAAVDDKLGRAVAIKVLRGELGEDRTAHKRFEREASVVARLAHPGIAQVLDFGTAENGASFIVLERVPGETVAAVLQRERRLAPGRAAEIARQALDALGAAHAHGVVHRDLKPGNLMVFATGPDRESVKVLDFGIAQLMQTDAYTRLTSTGAILGTPAFMAPEQASGMPTDECTDVYAMGVLLYCMLSGRRPFQGTPAEMIEAVVRGAAPPLASLVSDVPIELVRVVERAMQREPALRYATAQEMSREVAAAQRAARLPATGVWAAPGPTTAIDSSPFATRSGAPSFASPALAAPALASGSFAPGSFGVAVSAPETPAARPASSPFTRPRVVALVVAALIAGGSVVIVAGAALYWLWSREMPSVRAPGPAPESTPMPPRVTPSEAPEAPRGAGASLEAVCHRAEVCCEAYQAHSGGRVDICRSYDASPYAAPCVQYLDQIQRLGFHDAACELEPAMAAAVEGDAVCVRAYQCCNAWAGLDLARSEQCRALGSAHDPAYCEQQRAYYATMVDSPLCR